MSCEFFHHNNNNAPFSLREEILRTLNFPVSKEFLEILKRTPLTNDMYFSIIQALSSSLIPLFSKTYGPKQAIVLLMDDPYTYLMNDNVMFLGAYKMMFQILLKSNAVCK